MALAHSQAYSFYHWERAYDANADGIIDSIAREWWFRMKEAFLAAGWTLMGSYNGIDPVSNDGDRTLVDGVGGGAGTDNWLATVFANSSQRPWIVFQCPPIMGDIQIMLGWPQPLNNNPEYMDIRVSPSGSFMAINGGTDGTTSARPTAPDQITHKSNQAAGLSSQGDFTVSIHACWSADKSQFYFMTHQEQGNPHFFAFSKLDNPPAALQDGMVWCIVTDLSPSTILSDTRMQNALHYTSASWHGVVSGANRTFYLGGRGWNNAGIHAHLRIPQTRSTRPGPCELYASLVSEEGYYGTVPDIYWVAQSHYRKGFGDSTGGPINWFCGGGLLVPWDNTEPLPRVR